MQREVDRVIETADETILAYSPRQAAVVTSLSLRKVMADITAGTLRAYRKGRRRVILREDLLRYLTSSE